MKPFQKGDRVDARLLTDRSAVRNTFRGTILDREDALVGGFVYMVEFDHDLPGFGPELPGETMHRRRCQEWAMEHVSLLELMAEAAR